MKTKQVIHKAVAIASSLGFIGATMLGAVAVSPSYPDQFIKNGVFDGVIVVGQSAQTEDVVGAIDVGSSLQFALKKETNINVEDSPANINDGYKIQKSGSQFNYGDSINDVLSGTYITEEQLPSILSDGKYVESEGENKNSVTYTQKLLFGSDNGYLVYDQDDDSAVNAGDYFQIKKNEELYTYTLSFDSDVEYDTTDVAEDFKTSTLTIQGKTYTVTDVSKNSDGTIHSISLLSGEAVLWLTQNNPITKNINGVEHSIEVLDVTEGQDACQVRVDGVNAIIDEDVTKTINGVQIGIVDVRAIHAQLQDQDICQVTLGATELEITDGDELKVDDESLEGTDATIESTPGRLSEISVTFTPKEMDEDLYLKEKEAYTDPVFSSWKVTYAGTNEGYDTYSLKTSGDKRANLEFLNNDNKKIEIPFYREGTQVFLGEGNDPDERVYAQGNATSITASVCTGVTSVEDCEDMKILATTPGGEAHLFELTNINTNSNSTDLKDLTYGRTFNDVPFVPNTATNMDLGSFGNNVKLNINPVAKTVSVFDSINTKIETNNDGSIDINTTNPAEVGVSLFETNRNGNMVVPDELSPTTVNMVVDLSSSNDIRVKVASTNPSVTPVSKSEDSNYQVYTTAVGTQVTADTEDYNSITIESPKNEIYGNVFVSPIVSKLNDYEQALKTYTLSRLNVGAAKLDTEIADATGQNVIIVGGPCTNKVAAQVMGLTYPACGASSTIPQNASIIRTYSHANGKTSMVVAGWNAIDTKRATRVLANYDNYDLSSGSVIVSTNSLGEITVVKAE